MEIQTCYPLKKKQKIKIKNKKFNEFKEFTRQELTARVNDRRVNNPTVNKKNQTCIQLMKYEKFTMNLNHNQGKQLKIKTKENGRKSFNQQLKSLIEKNILVSQKQEAKHAEFDELKKGVLIKGTTIKKTERFPSKKYAMVFQKTSRNQTESDISQANQSQKIRPHSFSNMKRHSRIDSIKNKKNMEDFMIFFRKATTPIKYKQKLKRKEPTKTMETEIKPWAIFHLEEDDNNFY